MAHPSAIAATAGAIASLLRSACPAPDFPDAQFSVYQASDFQRPMEFGASLYLFLVAPNTARRNAPARPGAGGPRPRPPLVVDLHFLLSVWAPTARRQQQLLGWVLRTLQDTPVLPAGLLNAAAERPDAFRPDETVEVVLDPLPLTNAMELWEALKVPPPLSVGYVARGVSLDSESRPNEPAAAQAREVRLAEPAGGT